MHIEKLFTDIYKGKQMWQPVYLYGSSTKCSHDCIIFGSKRTVDIPFRFYMCMNEEHWDEIMRETNKKRI